MYAIRSYYVFGGREAEAQLCDDLSIGSTDDLDRATQIARSLVVDYGMGDELVGVQRLAGDDNGPARGEALRQAIDDNVRAILEEERARAGTIIADQRNNFV